MFSQQLAKFKIETKIKTSLRARGPPGVSGALCSLRILRIGRIGSAHRLIDIFETLIDRFHETFVCINCSDFFFNMHSNIYSCLFRDANIKEENIIDSHAA